MQGIQILFGRIGVKHMRYRLVDDAFHAERAIVVADLLEYGKRRFGAQGLRRYKSGIGKAAVTCHQVIANVRGKNGHGFAVPLDDQ
jgi:hypothetical protein